MPKEWYLLNRPLYNSGLENNEFDAYAQDGFQELLESFIAKEVLIYPKTIMKEPIITRAIVQNVTSDTSNNTLIRQILCPIGLLMCGQYVKIGESYWLVATYPDNNQIYEKAILWKCKYIIRFVSPLDGQIVEYPTYSLNSTQYGTGEYNREHITVGEGQHLMYLPYNQETVLLDDQFRFIMDRNAANPTVYRITQVDNTSYAVGHENEGGLIEWHTEEVRFNEATDSGEYMIADYISIKNTENPDDGSDEISDGESKIILYDLDGDCKLALGESKQIRAMYATPDGIEKPLTDYIVNITPENDGVKFSCDGSIITVSANYARELIGKLFIIGVSDKESGLSGEIKIQIVSW